MREMGWQSLFTYGMVGTYESASAGEVSFRRLGVQFNWFGGASSREERERGIVEILSPLLSS